MHEEVASEAAATRTLCDNLHTVVEMLPGVDDAALAATHAALTAITTGAVSPTLSTLPLTVRAGAGEEADHDATIAVAGDDTRGGSANSTVEATGDGDITLAIDGTEGDGSVALFVGGEVDDA